MHMKLNNSFFVNVDTVTLIGGLISDDWLFAPERLLNVVHT